jgi:hypothetical protein
MNNEKTIPTQTTCSVTRNRPPRQDLNKYVLEVRTFLIHSGHLPRRFTHLEDRLISSCMRCELSIEIFPRREKAAGDMLIKSCARRTKNAAQTPSREARPVGRPKKTPEMRLKERRTWYNDRTLV